MGLYHVLYNILLYLVIYNVLLYLVPHNVFGPEGSSLQRRLRLVFHQSRAGSQGLSEAVDIKMYTIKRIMLICLNCPSFLHR